MRTIWRITIKTLCSHIQTVRFRHPLSTAATPPPVAQLKTPRVVGYHSRHHGHGPQPLHPESPHAARRNPECLIPLIYLPPTLEPYLALRHKVFHQWRPRNPQPCQAVVCLPRPPRLLSGERRVPLRPLQLLRRNRKQGLLHPRCRNGRTRRNDVRLASIRRWKGMRMLYRRGRSRSLLMGIGTMCVVLVLSSDVY